MSILPRRAAPIKRTAVEKQVNIHIIFLFGFLLALSIGSTIGASINTVCTSPEPQDLSTRSSAHVHIYP